MVKNNLPEGCSAAPPHIPCADYWPGEIPKEKLLVYRQLLDEGQLSALQVIYNQRVSSFLITYLANQPHIWVRDTLAQRLQARPPPPERQLSLASFYCK